MDEFSSRTAKILIVEDEADIRELLHTLLELEGYSVEVACNGQDGLERLRACAEPDMPNLILLDIMMPVKDGFAFRAEQETDPRFAHIPVVVMSADAHVEEKTARMRVRASVRKPVDVEPFLALLVREIEQANEPPILP